MAEVAGAAADTTAVRSGEDVPVEALRGWLATAMPLLVPAGCTMDVRQFPAGFSNLTYLVTLHHEHGDSGLVLRRPPRGVSGGIAHDVAREYGILAALHPLGVPVPRPLVKCDEPSVIGAPFYLMEHVRGVILRGAAPSSLPQDGETVSGRLRALSRTFVHTLTQLHAVPVDDGPLATLGRPEGYVQRQVQGWTRRWQASRTDDVPSIDRVATWLEANRPPERGVSLVHNDFKLDNLILSPDLSQVLAILDWEMATVGDPLMDLGTSLAYWVEAGDAPIFRSLGLGVTALPGAYTRAELVAAYGAASGRDVSDAPFYLAFGLFKVAVIAQQIFARYRQGLTADPRFASLGKVVAALGERAEGAVLTA